MKYFRFILKILNRGILQWIFLRLAVKVDKTETKLLGIGLFVGCKPLSGYRNKDYKGIFKGKMIALTLEWKLK